MAHHLSAKEKVQRYYQQHLADYTQTVRQMRHILVHTKSRATEIEHELRNGASFARLARRYSIDRASAVHGGRYLATKGTTVPAYDHAAFTLETGALAVIDSTSSANGGFGWFVVQAVGPVRQQVQPFSAVQNAIRLHLHLGGKVYPIPTSTF